jgi:hypothetical protein
VHDDAWRAAARTAGLVRAAELTWDRSASEIHALLAGLAGRGAA